MTTQLRLWAVGVATISLAIAAPPAWAGKHHKTFKNDDVVAANDFHGKTSGTGKTKTASAKHVETGNQAFPDKTLGANGQKEWDWLAADNSEEIPAGDRMTVCTTGTSGISRDSFFTRNGQPLPTKVVKTKLVISFDGANSGQVCWTNDDVETLEFSNVEARVNNTGDVDAVGEYVPDGDVVAGIPTTFSLNIGETVCHPFSGNSKLLAVSMRDDVALASAPGALFPELRAETPLSAGAIPAVSTWGLTVLTLLVLAAGTVVLRRWRSTVAG